MLTLTELHACSNPTLASSSGNYKSVDVAQAYSAICGGVKNGLIFVVWTTQDNMNYGFLTITIISYTKSVGKGETGRVEAPPQILRSCYYVYKQLLQKDVRNLEKQERKKQLSGYRQCYTYKNQSLEVSKCMNLALVMCNKLDPKG